MFALVNQELERWVARRLDELVDLRALAGLTDPERAEFEDLCDIEAWILIRKAG
jgi:hypothetical protein